MGMMTICSHCEYSRHTQSHPVLYCPERQFATITPMDALLGKNNYKYYIFSYLESLETGAPLFFFL